MNSPTYYDIPDHWDHRALNRVQREVLWLLGRQREDCPPGARVLDAGAGDGLLINEFLRRYSDLEGVAVDFSEEALRHVLPPAGAVLGDISRLPFPNGHFALTWCIDVFEHLPPVKSEQTLAELVRVTAGSLLIVTPYLESDAVVTRCPHCRTIFNPYHHVNVLSMSRWETLLQPWSGSRDLTFVPLGAAKPYLPHGMGRLMASAGAFCTHGKTVCPLCQCEFRRGEAEPIKAGNAVLGRFVEAHRHSAGAVPEEMGVLVRPRQEKRQDLPDHTIWIDAGADEAWSAELECDSPLAIDFSDDRFGHSGQSLMEYPAYWLAGPPLAPAPGVDSQPAQAGDPAASEPAALEPACLHAVLPPDCIDKAASMVLEVAAKERVTISILAFNRATNGYDDVHRHTLPAADPSARFAFTLELDSEHVTAFGVILRLEAFPAPACGAPLVFGRFAPEQARQETVALHGGLNSLRGCDMAGAVFRLRGGRAPVREFLVGGRRRMDYAAMLNSNTLAPLLLPGRFFLASGDEPAPCEAATAHDAAAAALDATEADLLDARREIKIVRPRLSAAQQRTVDLEGDLRQTSLRAVTAEADLAAIYSSRGWRLLQRLRRCAAIITNREYLFLRRGARRTDAGSPARRTGGLR